MFFLLLFGVSIFGASAQTVGLSPYLDSVAEEFHVVRNVPEGFRCQQEFSAVKLGTPWGKHRELGGIWVKDKGKIGLVGALLQSDDRQCAVIYEMIDIYQFNGIGFPIEQYRGAYVEQQWKHRGVILAILMTLLDTADFRYEDYVSIVSGREARRRFGADSVFTFEAPIEPKTLADERYTRCAMLYLSRRGRAYLGFAFFFTEEGYKQKAKYMQALEGAVYYKRGRWRNKPEQVQRAERQNRKKRS